VVGPSSDGGPGRQRDGHAVRLFARAVTDPVQRERFTEVLDQFFDDEEDPATTARL
jgi:hypothetical protein